MLIRTSLIRIVCKLFVILWLFKRLRLLTPGQGTVTALSLGVILFNISPGSDFSLNGLNLMKLEKGFMQSHWQLVEVGLY